MKERSFQMLNYALCLERDFFCDMGGFMPGSGKFACMDLCLRANEAMGKNVCIYLPSVCLMSLQPQPESFDPDASAYFYGRWHGSLWESQTALYEEDNITQDQIDTARMARAAVSSDLGF